MYNLNPHSSRGKLRSFVVNSKLVNLLILSLFGYLLLAWIFAIAYYLLNCLPETTFKFLRSVYFSMITQTTIGYGDIVPKNLIGQFLAAIQSILGTMYISFVIAIVIYKFISIPEYYVKIEEKAIFTPSDGTLRIRFMNVSVLRFFNVQINVYLRVWLSSQSRFATYDIFLKRETIPVLEPFIPWNIATRPITENQEYPDLAQLDSTRKIYFHPKYVNRKYVPDTKETFLIVIIKGVVPVTNSFLYKVKIFHYDDVLCGKYMYVSPSPGVYKWENWGKYILNNKCEDCIFKETCGIKNRRRAPSQSAP